jgi:hypothetical protein
MAIEIYLLNALLILYEVWQGDRGRGVGEERKK